MSTQAERDTQLDARARDLTRVGTFQWAPGTNHVSFGGLWPPDLMASANELQHPVEY